MIPKINYLYVAAFIIQVGCGSSNAEKDIENSAEILSSAFPAGDQQAAGIVSEWE